MEKPKTKNNFHLLYKKLGETPLHCVERFKTEYPEFTDLPMTYAGRLDPMAEGLLLVLSGEEVKNKEKYLALPKTYVFEMLWGCETDTLDVLGILSSEISFWSQLFRGTRKIVATIFAHSRLPGSESPRKNYDQTKFPSDKIPIVEIVEMGLKKMVGKFEQKYPVYSSRPVNGKPLFQWAREGKLGEVVVPSHEVELFSVEFVSRRVVSGEKLLSGILEKVDLVSGDFRQGEIKEKWQKVLSESYQKEFTIDTIRLQCSGGFYVRQFVADIASRLGATATTFHILRERVGDFVVEK